MNKFAFLEDLYPQVFDLLEKNYLEAEKFSFSTSFSFSPEDEITVDWLHSGKELLQTDRNGERTDIDSFMGDFVAMLKKYAPLHFQSGLTIFVNKETFLNLSKNKKYLLGNEQIIRKTVQLGKKMVYIQFSYPHDLTSIV